MTDNLFEHAAADRIRREAPLARRVAPRTLDDVVGQDHILGPGKILRRAIEAVQRYRRTLPPPDPAPFEASGWADWVHRVQQAAG